MAPLPAGLVNLIDAVNRVIINPIIGVLSVLALLLFVWGGVQFIRSADSPPDRLIGQQHMIWGIVGLLVMVSVYLILNVGLNTFNVGPGDYPSEIPL